MKRLGAVALPVAIAVSAVLGALAAWPIYQTPRLWLVAAVATGLGAGLALLRRRVPLLPLIALGLLGFVVAALATAMPSAWHDLPGSLGDAALDALAAIVLGWKQLLTLELPVGSYQATLVPFLIVLTVTACLATIFGRSRFAAIPLAAPVVWGTVFGAAAVSEPVTLGPVTLVAPREVGLWLVTAAGAAFWVWLRASAARRAALKRGGGGQRRAGRPLTAAASLVIAAAVALTLLPAVASGARTVPRDRVDPELIINREPSALAAYRASKADAALDRVWFTVTSDGDLPERLTLVALDEYDGTDFHVSQSEAGQFTRFPSGDSAARSARVTVTVDGYRGIWAPIAAPLSSTPEFAGERSRQLSDSFYVNRATGTAIAVPTAAGLRAGDRYTIAMHTGSAPALAADAAGGDAAASGEPGIALDAMPQLKEWLDRQGTTDLAQLIARLRERGYLSHSLTDNAAWLERLDGVRFVSTPGGHSRARVEDLFAQLNADPDTVAAIGDDEQFAAAGAIIARALGYESRVVLGFRLAEDVPGIPACDGACTGENLAAWIEVRTPAGWAPVDVSPQIAEPPATSREGERLPEFPTVPEERDAQPVDPPAGLGEQNDREPEPNETDTLAWLWPVLRVTGLALLAALCVLVPALLIPVAKRVRMRRRRRAAVPQERALGAWNELRDRALDHRVALPVPRGRSTGDPLSEAGGSRRAQARVMAHPGAEQIAAEVDRSVYSASDFTLADADAVWQELDEVLQERFAPSLRAAYSLRSLGVPRMGRTR